MEFKKELNNKVEEINALIGEYLPAEEGFQKTIMEAMNYSILAGGKRLRPMLIGETYKLFGGDGEVVKPFMVAMEMIQTYSLVHDDLPAMDNDEYRRGKKSTHAQFGEAMGILAGDALLNYAFEVAAGAFDIDCSPKVAKALQVLGKKAGIYGMVGGQVVDIESEGKEISFETLQYIHKNKCGALIEGAMMIGAYLAGASEDEVKTIEQIGANVGLAFQIQDDILDVTSTAEVLGKPVGSDDKNDKITYVTFVGLEKAKEEVARLSNEAIEKLEALPYKNEFLVELIKSLICREY